MFISNGLRLRNPGGVHVCVDVHPRAWYNSPTEPGGINETQTYSYKHCHGGPRARLALCGRWKNDTLL